MNSLIHKTDMKRPHVVILEASANRPALPNGDKNRKSYLLCMGFFK